MVKVPEKEETLQIKLLRIISVPFYWSSSNVWRAYLTLAAIQPRGRLILYIAE